MKNINYIILFLLFLGMPQLIDAGQIINVGDGPATEELWRASGCVDEQTGEHLPLYWNQYMWAKELDKDYNRTNVIIIWQGTLVNYIVEDGERIGEKWECKPVNYRYNDGPTMSLDEYEEISLYYADSMAGILMARKMMGFFGQKLWDPGRFIKSTEGASGMCKVGILIAFVLMIIQLFSDFVVSVMGAGTHPIKILQKNLTNLLMVAILLTPGVYDFLVIKLVGGITSEMANSVYSGYIIRLSNLNATSSSVKPSDIENEAQKMIRNRVRGIAGQKQAFTETQTVSAGTKMYAKNSASTGSFLDQTIAALMGAVVYILSTILLLIFPVLQSFIFAVAYYIGPICIAFLAFEVLAGITTAWFSFLLTAGFWGLFASLALYIGSLADGNGVDGNLIIGGMFSNSIICVIYGLLSIVMLATSYPIAASIFGGGGGFTGIASAGTQLALGAAGVSALAAGSASKVGSLGAKLLAVGAKAAGAKKAASRLSRADHAMNKMSKSTLNAGLNYTKNALGLGGDPDKVDDGVTGGGRMKAERKKILKNIMQRMEKMSEDGVRDLRHDWMDAENDNLRMVTEADGFDSKDVQFASFDDEGRLKGVSMEGGAQYTLSDKGWERRMPAAESKLQQAAATAKMSATDKENMVRASKNRLAEINRVIDPNRAKIAAALSDTPYKVRDIGSVDVDRDNNITGLTMKTGEQYSYEDGNINKV